MAYSDNEKAEALIRLAVNKYDFAKTEQELGVSVKTLRRWDRNAPKSPKKHAVDVPYLLERAIGQLLSTIPANIDSRDWGIALGILMDKWLLVQGKATSRNESINKRIGDLSGSMLDDVLAEAGRILEETESGGPDPRPGPSED